MIPLAGSSGCSFDDLASDGRLTLRTQLKQRESVARMTWDGLSYLASAAVRFKGRDPPSEMFNSEHRLFFFSNWLGW